LEGIPFIYQISPKLIF